MNWIYPFLLVNIVSGLFNICYCQESEEEYYEFLESTFDSWYSNYDLTLDDIDQKLDSIQDDVVNKYSSESESNAFILHKKGVLRANSTQYEGAISYYREALLIRKNILSRTDSNTDKIVRDIINGHNNISACYSLSYKPYLSIQEAEKALELVDLIGNVAIISRPLYHLYVTLGRAYYDIGDFDNSIKYYKLIYDVDTTLHQDDDNWKSRALIESAFLLGNSLQRPDSAIQSLEIALNHIVNNDEIKADANLELANSYYQLQEYDLALDFCMKSIELYENSNSGSKAAESFLTASVIFLHLDSLEETGSYLDKAIQIFVKNGVEFKLANVYDNYGDLAFKQSRYKQALEYDNKSITYILPKFEPSSILSNPNLDSALIPNKLGLLKSLDSKGESLLALFEEEGDVSYLENALQTYNLADRVIDRIRSDFVAEASKFNLAEQTRPVYSRAIEACWHLYQETEDPGYISEALGFSEKSRSVVLLDAIRKSKAKTLLPSELVQKENELNLRVNFLEKTQALKEGESLDSLLYYRREHSKIKEEIRRNYPSYYSAIFEAGKLDLQKLRASLPGDTDYLEFFQGTNEWFVFRISRDQLSMNQIKTEMDIQTMVSQLNDKIQSQVTDFIKEATNLYHALLPYPVLESRRLLIIPDGVLHLLNFDLLMKEDPGRSPVLEDYLISDHEISYAYSLTTLTEMRTSEGEKKGFLGLSPAFERSLEFKGKQYGALSQNIEEVREIESIIGGQIITNALHIDSLRAIISNYQYIHFSTHAEANDENGDLSMIFLSPSSVLYAKDIYTLSLNADMVVLSACRTNAGSVHAGEGIVSLARSFAYAGTPSVLTSLWNVREKPNQEIMIELYRGLKRGYSKDKALRDAKLKFLSSLGPEDQHLSHPYFWAPLVMIGDRRAVISNKVSPQPFIVAIIILGFLIALRLKRH